MCSNNYTGRSEQIGRINVLKEEYYKLCAEIKKDMSVREKKRMSKGIIRVKGRIAEAYYLSAKVLDILERGFWGEDSGYDAVFQLKEWDYKELITILIDNKKADDS